MNPKAMRALRSFSNQALGACFNPYKDLCNLHTKWGCLGSINLGGCSMNTSSCKSPFKNALLISNCLTTQFFAKAIVNTTLIVVGLNTGLNWDTLARIWTAKYLSKVHHTWAEFSLFTIRARIPSDIEERSQDNSNWSCCSQSRNSGLTLSISSSLSARNFNGGGCVLNTKFCNLCPQIATRTCFHHSKKLLLSN